MHPIPSSHPLYIIGDYHQASAKLLTALKKIPTPASLIMLGDYPSTGRGELSDLRSLLSQFDLTTYLLRGNHDNPLYWQDRELAAVFETDRFKLLHEVDVIRWRDQHILTINGAVSVDRMGLRTSHDHCWPDTEGVPGDALAQIATLIKNELLPEGFDHLLAHTGLPEEPSTPSHFLQQYLNTDPKLQSDLDAERRLMKQILIASKAKTFHFGHFHISATFDDYGVDCQCLGICEMVELS